MGGNLGLIIMPILKNIIKVTKDQMNKLLAGENVGGYTLDDNTLYMVETATTIDDLALQVAEVRSLANAAQDTADGATSTAQTAQSTAESKYTKPSGGIPAADLAGSIPTTKLTGLATVATTGKYTDLINTPTYTVDGDTLTIEVKE